MRARARNKSTVFLSEYVVKPIDIRQKMLLTQHLFILRTGNSLTNMEFFGLKTVFWAKWKKNEDMPADDRPVLRRNRIDNQWLPFVHNFLPLKFPQSFLFQPIESLHCTTTKRLARNAHNTLSIEFVRDLNPTHARIF